MLPCLAMRKTGSWARAGRAARTNPTAAEHNKTLQDIVILSSCWPRARDDPRQVSDFSDKIMLEINNVRALLPSTANESGKHVLVRFRMRCGRTGRRRRRE